MLKFDINELIKVKKEKDDYFKKWLLYGLFGRHKSDKTIGYFYAFLTITSIMLLILSLFCFIENLFTPQETTYTLKLFISGALINSYVTCLWAIDLIKQMKIYDEKIKHLETGEN